MVWSPSALNTRVPEAVKYAEFMIERGIKLTSSTLSKLKQSLVKERKEFVCYIDQVFRASDALMSECCTNVLILPLPVFAPQASSVSLTSPAPAGPEEAVDLREQVQLLNQNIQDMARQLHESEERIQALMMSLAGGPRYMMQTLRR
ncbi:hypothetical protein PIB30_066694 [Stylosanthes scabra]|uniref:Uncharacterized protein n=1 Tax=Stylosanthes scabra TaxID=79078 RepID=A0ABU6TML5_9FABA|nr:hypothetical protein [Stylosanthes scabra]